MKTRFKNFIVYFVATLIILLALSTLSPIQAQDQAGSTGATARAAMEADLPEPESGEDLPDEFVSEVRTIIQDGDYAYGSWIFGEMGGVAIAQRQNGQWTVICSTGGVYQPNEMVQSCEVPADTAESLWEKWLEETE